MKEPLVSVVVTSYNHAKFIATALDSVYAQTWKNIEVIVVDDASTDGSQSIISRYKKRYGLTFIKRKSNYYSAEVKSGEKPIIEAMKRARGKYIAVVDSDDIILPDKISDQVALMEKNPECTLCYGDVKLLRQDGTIGNYSNYFASGDLFSYLLITGNCCLYIGSLIRKTSFQKIDPSHPDLVQEDWDMFLRLAKIGPFISDTKTVAYYRRHDNNTWYRLDRSALMYRNRMMILDYWRESEEWPQAMNIRWEMYMHTNNLSPDEIDLLLKERPQDALLHYLKFVEELNSKNFTLASHSILRAISYCDSRLKVLPQLYKLALKIASTPSVKKMLLNDMKKRLSQNELTNELTLKLDKDEAAYDHK